MTRTNEAGETRVASATDTAAPVGDAVSVYPHTMRLQRFLARAGVASRRGSEDLMTAGRVTVNGEVATELGTKVDVDRDHIEVDCMPVKLNHEACGVTPTLVRPPGGFYNQASLDTLGSMGMAAIMWDIDTLDWKTRNAQNTINVVLNQVKDGDIVLMHDIYSTSADAAEVIIPELVNRGYQLVTVSEMAQYRGGIQAGHVYNRFRP